ncbi:hypothetical protein JCM19000A_14330 [Silvimonas sp. JCM 19000]
MNPHLVLPHASWPDPALQSQISAQLQLPALATLFGKGQRQSVPAQAWSSWLHMQFGSAAAAPLTLALDLPDAAPGYWLRADPVHLHVGRDQLSLQDARTLDISQNDANALVLALNGLFKQDGWTFHAPHPNRWYLQLAADPQLQFTPLDEVIGLNIDPFLPRGPDAMNWHRALNELQMLLYTHATNDVREALGKLSINSIWLWGGGAWPMPALPQQTDRVVWSDDDIVQGLTRASGGTALAMPAGAQDLPARPGLVIVDSLAAAVRANDAQAWYAAWQALEQHWFAPLLAGLQEGSVSSVTLTAPDAGWQVRTDASLRWRFWQGKRLPF